MHHGHVGSQQIDPSLMAWAAAWALMVVAMMWPLLASTLTLLPHAVTTRWRRAATIAYLGTFSTLWLGAGLLARVPHALAADSPFAGAWTVSWLCVALIVSRWSLWRARLLRTCQPRVAIAPAGWRTMSTSARAAARGWLRCAALCGPVMVAMVSGHELAAMAGGSAAVWWEQRHPRVHRDPVVTAVLAVTIVVCVVARF